MCWKEFSLNEIFTEIQRGKRLKKDDHIRGNVPYVSSSAINNAVDDFIGNKSGVRIFNDCLTMANSGSVGASFYQPFSFVASDHVTKLKNTSLNKYNYLYISSIVNRLGEKYSFNREINDKRIRREKIMLPCTEDDKLDYKYMEYFMRNIEFEMIEKYIRHLANI